MTQAVILSAVYLVLVFVLPVTSQTIGPYRMGASEFRLMHFAVAVPTIIVWFAAFICFGNLKQYAELVKSTPEGSSYRKLANGCGWLAWTLPATVFSAIIASALANEWPGMRSTLIILANYIDLILPLVGFSIIGLASGGLISTAKINFKISRAWLLIVAFLVLGVLYCYFTFTHFDTTSFGATSNPYHLPIWLLLLTVIIPYLYTWFVGLLSIYELAEYSRNTKGFLYRRALSTLAAGLAIIVAGSIALQYLNGVVPRNGHLVFDGALFLMVVFKVITGIGFIVLSSGAVKLKKIEEV